MTGLQEFWTVGAVLGIVVFLAMMISFILQLAKREKK